MRIMRKTVKLALKIILSLILGSTLALGILAWRLHQAPISLNFLIPHFQKALTEFSFSNATLEWRDIYSAPILHFEDLNLQKDPFKIHTTKASIKLDILKLVTGNIAIKNLMLDSPSIEMTIDPLSSAKSSSPESSSLNVFTSRDMEKTLKEVDKNLHTLHNKLKHITLQDATFIITEKKAEESPSLLVCFSHLSANMGLKKSACSLTASGDMMHQTEIIPFTIEALYEPGNVSFSFSFSPLSLSLLESSYTPANPMFANLTIPLSGNIHGSLKKDKNRYEGLIDVQSNFHISNPSEEPLKVPLSLNMKASWQDKGLMLDSSAQISPFPVASLPSLWPQSLGVAARNWVLTNIKGGQASRGDIQLKGFLSEEKSFVLSDLKGHVTIENADVTYMDQMPKITKATAAATFDAEKFHIEILKGQTRNLKIQKGTVILAGLDKPDQTADIHLTIASPLGDALWLLSRPPLNYTQQYHISSDNASGRVAIDLRLLFPLETKVKISDLKAFVSASLLDCGFALTLGNPSSFISHGNFMFSLSPHKMVLEGKGLLNGDAFSINGHEIMTDGQEYKTKFTIQSPHINVERLFPLGLDFLKEKISGFIGLNLTYTKQEDGKSDLKATADLSNALLSIPEFQWKQTLLSPGKAKAFISFLNGDISGISDLKIQNQSFFFKGDFAFHKGSLVGIDIPALKLEGMDLEAQLYKKNNIWNVSLKGNVLNLKPWLDKISDSSDIEGSAFKGNASFNTVLLDKSVALRNVKASFTKHPDEWESIDVKADFHKQDTLILKYRPLEGRKELLFGTSNLGLLLKGLDLTDSLKGGEAKILASKPYSPQNAPLAGSLFLKNLRITHAPVLAQLLTVTSFQGMVNTLRGKGIIFEEGEIPFKLKEDVLFLKRALIYNGSLGLTGEGFIHLKNKKIGINGAVIPAFMINNMFGRIPLLGPLLTGGDRNRGVISVSYSIAGDLKNPKVSTNPLSAFAPGVMKDIFRVKPKEASKEAERQALKEQAIKKSN
jgi:hypothetical protein